MKRFKKIRIKNNFLIISIISIILLCGYILNYINVKISPKLTKISEYSLDTYNNRLIMEFISSDNLSNDDLNELISLIKNKKDEIISVDYNIEKSYKILSQITDGLYNIINNMSFKDITDYKYDVKDDLILYYPIGLASDYIYFNNLGPKIPVKIKFLNSLVTGISTKVSNYGINNVLVEIYVNINIEDNIVIPFKEESINKSYTVLLSSKLIIGQVPSFLGGTIENNSPIVTSNWKKVKKIL